jgi:hypothetical protein
MVHVLTNRYDNARTGTNTQEAVLTTGNVNVNDFGKLFGRAVAGQIYAQPLVVSGLTLPGFGVRNVVYVATTQNRVYAYDADDPAASDPLWHQRLGPSVPRTDYTAGYRDFSSEIGITSTPTIDLTAKTIYVVAKTKEVIDGRAHYAYRLHALDLTTGAEQFGGPVTISETALPNNVVNPGVTTGIDFVSGPSVPGQGSGSVSGTVHFNAYLQHQRPGLLLMSGALYVAFASHGDQGAYHGWLLAYDATTLALIGTYCTTPNSGEGGIWQSGCGLAGDGTSIYAVIGNGSDSSMSDAALASGPSFGHSVVRLTHDKTAKTLTVADWFTPFDIRDRNRNDDDLCAGPVLLPWGNLLGAWGKDKAYYVMDRGKMGHYTPGSNAITQFAPGMTRGLNDPTSSGSGGGTGHIHCAPVVFEHPALGPISYVWGENDDLRGYRFDKTELKFEGPPPALPTLQSTTAAPIGMPGGMLSASCNGSQPNTAIVWAAHPIDGNANQATVTGILEAFAADDLRAPIWRSNHDPLGADAVGNFAKFCPPVVANGKVYLATFSNELAVYGLLPGGVAQGRLGKWQQADVQPPKVTPPLPGDDPNLFQVEGSATLSCRRFTILGAGHDIWEDNDGFHFVYQPLPKRALTLSARVLSMTRSSPWAKAGIMIRESLAPGAPNAFVAVTPDNGVVFQYRTATKANSAPVVDTGAPFGASPADGGHVWLRLVSVSGAGNAITFSGFASLDGTTWQSLGPSQTLDVGAGALFGLAVTSHSDGVAAGGDGLDELCVALIDKVTTI